MARRMICWKTMRGKYCSKKTLGCLQRICFADKQCSQTRWMLAFILPGAACFIKKFCQYFYFVLSCRARCLKVGSLHYVAETIRPRNIFFSCADILRKYGSFLAMSWRDYVWVRPDARQSDACVLFHMCVSPTSAIGTSGMWLDDTEVTPLHFGTPSLGHHSVWW